MTEEYNSSETDWIANSIYGYGVGYTKEQALQAMFAACDPEGYVTVTLIEHVGNATMGMGGVEVDEFVSGERVEIPETFVEELKRKALESKLTAETAIDSSEKIEEL